MAVPFIGNIQGLDFLNKINFSGLLSSIGRMVTFVIILGLITAIVGYIMYSRKNKKLYNIDLHFFEEVNGQMIPVKDMKAAELVVPGTNIRVFHVKENDLYLPRGTRLMGKNSYWYAIRSNRELVNFTLVNINKEMKEAKLDYDHTDQRYAYTNLKEIIKRNYRDKSVKWWKEYKDVIATVVFIFVLSLSFFFLISRMGKLIDSIGPLIESAAELQKQNADLLRALSTIKQGSGLATVP